MALLTPKGGGNEEYANLNDNENPPAFQPTRQEGWGSQLSQRQRTRDEESKEEEKKEEEEEEFSELLIKKK